MEQKEKLKLESDLRILTKKHNLKNCAFCGMDAQDHFFGQLITDKTYTGVWETALNVGRLWQFVREETRTLLNMFDKRL